MNARGTGHTSDRHRKFQVQINSPCGSRDAPDRTKNTVPGRPNTRPRRAEDTTPAANPTRLTEFDLGRGKLEESVKRQAPSTVQKPTALALLTLFSRSSVSPPTLKTAPRGPGKNLA
jgi:hypothetical protein